ncbi:MAG TPA: YciI family protein [Streptosporangiaceae bacterium]|jgi:hypothetical protein
MKYLCFVAGDDLPGPEELAVMQREIPGWVKEMGGRGVRLLGRALDIPETGVTVRVRDGETLVTDGPFVEAKEFIAGFDILECADLDEAIAVAGAGPVARFMTIEIRPFAGQPVLGGKAPAFGRCEDGAASPYGLAMWTGGTPAAPPVDQALIQDVAAWRQDLAARGLHILGGTLEGADTTTTLRVRDGRTLLGDGPFFKTGEIIAAIDVVSCAERQQAIQLAATHPAAGRYAIEVRPFENV